MYAEHPNTLKWLMLGFFPYQASNGVLSPRVFVGLRLIRYAAVDRASAQKLCGSLESASTIQTVSTNVQFILSATPFCSSVFGMVYTFLLEVAFELDGYVFTSVVGS